MRTRTLARTFVAALLLLTAVPAAGGAAAGPAAGPGPAGVTVDVYAGTVLGPGGRGALVVQVLPPDAAVALGELQGLVPGMRYRLRLTITDCDQPPIEPGTAAATLAFTASARGTALFRTTAMAWTRPANLVQAFRLLKGRTGGKQVACARAVSATQEPGAPGRVLAAGSAQGFRGKGLFLAVERADGKVQVTVAFHALDRPADVRVRLTGSTCDGIDGSDLDLVRTGRIDVTPGRTAFLTKALALLPGHAITELRAFRLSGLGTPLSPRICSDIAPFHVVE